MCYAKVKKVTKSQNDKSYTLYILFTFQHCVFSNVSSNCLPERMQTHTGNICLPFLHCVFSNGLSKHVHKQIHNHTGCICLTFLCHLSLSLESHWLCFYLNLVVQDFDPFLEVCWLFQFSFPTDMLRTSEVTLGLDRKDRN